MPKKKSMYTKGVLSLLSITFLLLFVSVSSCKSDKKDTNPSDLFDGPNSINFMIGGEQLKGADQIGKDITMLDYQEDRANKDYVLHVPINDSVYFKDVSQFSGDAPGERQWYLDEEKLPSNSREVAVYSEEVGPSIITLKFDDYNHVRKGIYFTDEFSFEEDFATPEEDLDTPIEEDVVNQMIDNGSTAMAQEEKRPAVQEKKSVVREEPRVAEKKSNVRNEAKVVEKKTPPPPPPVMKPEITSVSFEASKTTVEVREKISFKDTSQPSSAINQRVWDWGDGSTMPVRGANAGYSYLKAGTYNVKLCLNYTNKCTSKNIIVKPKADIVKGPPPEPTKKDDKPVVEIKKPTVSKVVVSAASKTLVGKPIDITDGTYPADAVESREWYVNGAKTPVTKKRFSKTFDKAGTYTVKLCVNGSSLCESTVIVVENKPIPVEPKKVVAAESKKTAPVAQEEFFPMANSRTGLRNSQRCPEADSKWHDGQAEITLSPTVRLELLNAKIYGQKVAQAKVTLKALDGSITRVINNVQILPGPSSIEFGDFSIVLQPGIKYLILIEPMPGETLQLEDGGSCNTSFAADERMPVSYKDNVMTLYDIKFSY